MPSARPTDLVEITRLRLNRRKWSDKSYAVLERGADEGPFFYEEGIYKAYLMERGRNERLKGHFISTDHQIELGFFPIGLKKEKMNISGGKHVLCH